MLDLTCGCFSGFSRGKIEVKLHSSLLYNTQQNHCQQVQTQQSNNNNNEFQGRGSVHTESGILHQTNSIMISQHAQSSYSGTTASHLNLHQDIMSNYSIIFQMEVFNSTIQSQNDFLYIVPDKAPLVSLYSSINSRYKIKIESSSNNGSQGSAKYNILNLALNEIYKIFYVRRNKEDKLEALHTTERFKLTLRTKAITSISNATPKSYMANSKSHNTTSHTINTFQNDNTYFSANGCAFEIVQAFEGDPDYYRENFEYEMKLLTCTPQNKHKQITNRFDTSPITAPFSINNQVTAAPAITTITTPAATTTNLPTTAIGSSQNANVYQGDTLQRSHVQQMIDKNTKNYSAMNSNQETSCNSLSQTTTNLYNQSQQPCQQYQRSHFNQNQGSSISESFDQSNSLTNKMSQSNGFNIHNTSSPNHYIISNINSNYNSQYSFTGMNINKNQSGQQFNGNLGKIDETFIVDDSKCNDYAMKMSNLLKQKIEYDNNHQQKHLSGLQLSQNQQEYMYNYNSPNNLNRTNELTLTNKQSKMKQKGKTLTNYNSDQVMQQGLKQIQNNKMLNQSAPKQNILAKKGSTQVVPTTTVNGKVFNRNHAFIQNSACSNNIITPQTLSKKNSEIQMLQSDNKSHLLTQSCQLSQKMLYKTFKDDLSQSQINSKQFIMQTPCKNSSQSQTNTSIRPPASAGLKTSQNFGQTAPRVLIDFQQTNSNQGSTTKLGKLLKSQQKSFLSSNKTSITNTPHRSEQKIQLRFENEINNMMVEQKINKKLALLQERLYNNQNPLDLTHLDLQGKADSNQNTKSSPSDQNNFEKQGENTPVEQKLFTVEEANSPFETSINRFYTQRSSPSKYRVTQTEYNRIDECDEYNNTQYSNSDLKRIKHQLKQFRMNDQEFSSPSSSHLKTFEYNQTTAFNPDYSKNSYNKNNSNQKQQNQQQLSRREKTIHYMIPVFEYKMEKLGFNFAYDAKNKNIIISQQKRDTHNHSGDDDKPLQQSVFKIDERIKTDQLTNYFEDICANIKYQTID